MYRILSSLMVCVMVLSGSAYAADSASFGVSCTIPAIPGVNAPPFAEDQAVNPDENTQGQEQQSGEKSGYETMLAQVIQEGNTIYSR